ncbi:MAG: 16S rRNA (guanine(966)-N(2))-methyltransferase RsmD [[Eubacterium] rectale]|nr:16S rRNA (guanine(966)-N(2))-methyltransferase RsmD [Agathobacter rectalis]
MRIIAGKGRSLPLKTIEGIDTRPTTDRIKETLFNMLQYEIADCRFLDLFAGSGQIGLEAVSRGANYAVFAENAKKAAACIEDNIRFTKFGDRCRLINSDAITAIRTLEGKYTFDIIFMDPPYDKMLERDVLEVLKDSSILKPDTIIVVEASDRTGFDYLSDMGYVIVKEKKYKTNKHVFIKRA